MQRHMLNALVAVVIALIVAPANLMAQSAATSPAGKWKFNITTPHGEMAMALEMKVDGKKVSGTLSSEQSGKQPLTGEFVDGKLTFSVSRDNGELKFIGKLKDKDTIVGDVAGHGMDMPCTATRIVEK